jgi:hypothetical protein
MMPTKTTRALLSAITDDSDDKNPRRSEAVEIWYRTEDSEIARKIIRGSWPISMKEVDS